MTVDGRGPEYYTLANIYVGATIHVYGRVFTITGADEAVLKYLDESGVHLPAICRESIEKFLYNKEQAGRYNEVPEEIKHIKVPVA